MKMVYKICIRAHQEFDDIGFFPVAQIKANP